MGTVELSHVSFAYAGGSDLLRDVSLRLPSGVTAIVGENGSGKSTLLRLIAGQLRPDEGSVRLLPAGGRVVTCEQSVEHMSELVRAFAASEDVHAFRLRALLEVNGKAIARWPSLSPGERKRLQIGAALWAEPEVLLLDEPTNHVDAEARALIIQALSKFRGVALLVSHDRQLIDLLAVQTVRLHRGEVRSVQGGYSQARRVWTEEAEEQRRQRDELVRQTHRAEAKLSDARSLQKATEKGRSAKALIKNKHDSDGRGMGRKNLAAWAESRASRSVAVQRKQAEDLRERLREQRVDKQWGGKIFARYEPCPRPVLVSLVDEDIRRGDTTILRNLTVSVARGARIRIEGRNGAGKSTLLSELRSRIRETERVLWLPQELTQAEIRELHRQTLELSREQKGSVLEVLASLGVDPSRLLASQNPSPGEARKLLMAHGLGRSAWALLLDEPTHHLDLPSVERLEGALCDYPGALLVVSHDPTFLSESLTTTWNVEQGRVRASDRAPCVSPGP